MMYIKKFLRKVIGNNVAAMFPQPIMFLIRAVIERYQVHQKTKA